MLNPVSLRARHALCGKHKLHREGVGGNNLPQTPHPDHFWGFRRAGSLCHRPHKHTQKVRVTTRDLINHCTCAKGCHACQGRPHTEVGGHKNRNSSEVKDVSFSATLFRLVVMLLNSGKEKGDLMRSAVGRGRGIPYF